MSKRKLDSFTSVFGPYIADFVSEKRGLGHGYDAGAGILHLFDVFVNESSITDTVITKALMDSWSIKRAHESDKTHQMRFWTVQQLSRYMVRMGLDSYVSPLELRNRKSTFRPYIFTDDELGRFLQSAKRLEYSSSNPKRHLILPMLFSILACTGLRLSEALTLRKSDVSFTGDNIIFFIHHAKFDKERMVPLSRDLSKEFMQYLEKLKPLWAGNDVVFPNRYGDEYSLNGTYYNFRKILWNAGISHGGRGEGPRIHDLRHTFAVKSLRNMAAKGNDTLSALPLLCKYMGHKNIHATQAYLTLTAELFPHITQIMESACGNIIPGLGVQNG